MDQSDSSANWIRAYMDWTDADSWTFRSDRLAGNVLEAAAVDAGGVFVAAYLDWMDAWQRIFESNAHHHAAGSAGDAGESGVDMLWDALMVALHTDSDCMPFLSEILDASETTQSEALAA
jgi:hypothetical protein